MTYEYLKQRGASKCAFGWEQLTDAQYWTTQRGRKVDEPA